MVVVLSVLAADGSVRAQEDAERGVVINDAFGLLDSEVVTLAPSNVAADELTVSLPVASASRQIRVRPASIRTADYRVFLQIEDGSLMRIAPAPESTYRGEVVGMEGSVVAATLSADGLRARILLPDGDEYWVEPLVARVAGAAAGEHVVYRDSDVIPDAGTCAANGVAAFVGGGTGTAAGTAGGAGLYIAELAIDADFDYYSLLTFQSQPDPAAAVQAHIENIVNAVNVQYERDVSIRHVLSGMIIRTAEPDPYFKTCIGGLNEDAACTTSGQCIGGRCAMDAEMLLLQFANEWRFDQPAIRRDLAQLFTGKTLDGSTIGIAYLGSVCVTSTQYSLVESNCFGCASFACKTDLSAHEMGHSWGAGHCGGLDCVPACPDHTMNCEITCANQFHPTETIPFILNHRDSRICLDLGDDLRRVVLLSDSNTVSEGGELPFEALADFAFGEDQIVTSEATWWVEPPEAGSIDSSGVFTAAEVNGNTCATIHVSYTNSGETVENFRTILIIDVDAPLAIVGSVPPDGAIDARQPSDIDGTNPTGWNAVELTFNGDTCLMTSQSFTVTKLGGVVAAPTIQGLNRIETRTVRLTLSKPIEPGTWTTINTGELSVRLGYQPGDSNGDGVSSPPDILSLIDALNGVRADAPIWSTDIDRSGLAGPPDILRLIDLLNGAGGFEPWLNSTLP